MQLSSNILSNLLGLPSTVTIQPGQTSANFTVNNLIGLLNGLLNPVTGTVTATLNTLSLNTGITLKIL